MAPDGFGDIISLLERQKTVIDKALDALRGLDRVDGNAPPASARTATPSPVTRKRGMTPEGKKRLIAALKKRWAAKKAAQTSASATPTAAPLAVPTTKKHAITDAGRKRLAEAMKRRWAVKRAGSAVKKTGRRGKRAPAGR
jgi:hypothetical protein